MEDNTGKKRADGDRYMNRKAFYNLYMNCITVCGH